MVLDNILPTDANKEFCDVLVSNTPHSWVVRESKACFYKLSVPYMWTKQENISTDDAQQLVESCGLEQDVVALDAADAFSLGFSRGEGHGTYVMPLETAVILSLVKVNQGFARVAEEAQR